MSEKSRMNLENGRSEVVDLNKLFLGHIATGTPPREEVTRVLIAADRNPNHFAKSFAGTKELEDSFKDPEDPKKIKGEALQRYRDFSFTAQESTDREALGGLIIQDTLSYILASSAAGPPNGITHAAPKSSGKYLV